MASVTYVIYPAALFDGWEVVKEGDPAPPAFFPTEPEAIRYAERQAALDGGAAVKLENWFGDTVRVWDVSARATDGRLSP